MAKDKDHIYIVPPEGQNKDKLPVLLRQVRENALSIFSAHLENLFSSCDDLFFDLSSRATSNNEQNLYFESMREVRLKKNGVIAAFKQEFETGFYQLPDSHPQQHRTQAAENTSNGTLSLVQNDTLEQDVAISSMISKARVNCQESLYHLNLRFDYLIANTTISEQNNPIDPQQICHYFATACEFFDLSIKARIIIFKQFDRFVSSKLATVYSAANHLLIEAGVLPKISYTARTASSDTDTNANPLPTAALNSKHSTELNLNELNDLLAAARTQNIASLPNYVSYSSNTGPALANTDLINLLTGTQQNLPPATDEAQLTYKLHNIITNILSTQGDNTQRSLQQPEEDVINLVAMFFDFILDDHNLPISAQALISRLQIPVLKIALRDQTFFNHSSHPARRLINVIAEVSIGWDESTQSQKDRLHDKASSIVREINEQYEENDHIFSSKLTELQLFIDQAQHKSSRVEKRTAQAAEGQAQNKLARQNAQGIMFEKLESLSLPETISAFLTQQWLNLLIITHLKYGEDSQEWIGSIQVIDDLTWISQLPSDTKSQQRFEKIKPDLLNRITQGLQKISNTSEAVSASVAAIDLTLDQLRNKPSGILFRPISSSQAQQLGHTPGGGSKSWKNMTGVERQQARYKQLTYEYIRKAEQLPLNTWVSYTDNHSGKTLRCKLASKTEQSDSYVFVNRFGFKALQKQRKDFACDIQAGRVTVLESGHLFDRAMNSVLGSIKLSAGQTAS